MQYKASTIARYLYLIKREIQSIRADMEHVRISDGNKKIGRVMNVSTAPIMCCGNCAKCKCYCYDIKANMQYKNVRHARAVNTVLAKTMPEKYFAQIDKAISRRRKNKYFRWHVAGDILSFSYFEHMVDIAIRHPDFVFWTYTKQYKIVNAWLKLHGGRLPFNMHVMYSKWEGMPMDNPYHMPDFRVRMEGMSEDPFKALHKCPGNCDACKVNGGRGCIAGETSYVDEH